jgi:hypothetical protein
MPTLKKGYAKNVCERAVQARPINSATKIRLLHAKRNDGIEELLNR